MTEQQDLQALPITTSDGVEQLIARFNQLQHRLRQNERLLQDHHRRLEMALDVARMQFIEWMATTEEPVADALLSLVCPEDRERIGKVIARDLMAYGQFLVEFRSAETRTSHSWFMARGRMCDPNAPDRQAIAMAWDITEFKMAELALYENEERFQAIVDSLNDAVFLQDQTGHILLANASACEMYGYSRDAFNALTVGDLSSGSPPYTQQEAVNRFSRALQGDPQFFEWRAKDARGRLFWVEASIQAASIGGVQQLVIVIHDIDSLKQAASALQESEERYRLLLEMSPDAIVVNREGVMEMANQSALRLFGAEREEQLLGLPWKAWVHPDSHDRVREQLEYLQKSDGLTALSAMEQCYLRLDGSVIEVEVTASAISLTEGRAVLFIARDITGRKTNEARLKTLLVQQEAILDNALVGIVLLKQRVITLCNRRYEEMFGYGEGGNAGSHYPDALSQRRRLPGHWRAGL